MRPMDHHPVGYGFNVEMILKSTNFGLTLGLSSATSSATRIRNLMKDRG